MSETPAIGRPRNDRSRLIVTTAAATLLLIVVIQAGWWIFSQWRLGRVVLTNDGAPLTVQVLGESDDTPIGEPVELVRRATLALPPGDYRLKVTGEGRLSRTYRSAVNQGESFTQSLSLDDNRLLGEAAVPPGGGSDPPLRDPIPFAASIVAIELTPGKADFVELSNGSLRCRDGATGQVIWDAVEPTPPGKPPRSYHPWLLWFVRNHFRAIRPIEPAPDVNGDGTRDLVWVINANFLAVSGKDGSVLWTYQAELDGPGGAYPEGPDLPGPIWPATRSARSIGVPATSDVDRDGVPDLVVTISFAEFPAETKLRRELARNRVALSNEVLDRGVVVAVSGRSGRHLWSHPVDPDFRDAFVPPRPRPAGIVQGRRSSFVAILDGTNWIGLDPATGRPQAGPIDLGFIPQGLVQYADLDGDGEPEIFAVGPGVNGNGQSLAAVSIAAGRPLWTGTMNARLGVPFNAGVLLFDLDGDGRAEIAMPDSYGQALRSGYRGVRVLDGQTGLLRWSRPMRPFTRGDDGLIDIIEAPDLDRDGIRDLVTTSIFLGREPINPNQSGPGEPKRVYVDALSGRDGRPLWWWHFDRPTDRDTFMGTPMWWGRGPDGWPLLAVPIATGHSQMVFRSLPASDSDPATVHILEASTGREVQSMERFEQTQVADLDGDGLPDLWGAAQNSYHSDLRAFRGEPPESWRALGVFRPAREQYGWGAIEFRPAADLDGDGIGDALIADLTAPGEMTSQATGSRTAIARSGRDGRVLWKADLGLRRGWFDRDLGETYALMSDPMPAGDLDGDGNPDVIAQEQTEQPPSHALRQPATLPLKLLSGRTGRPLWVAGPLPLGFEAHGYSGVQWVGPRIIEPGAAPDVIVRHDSPFLAASPTPPAPNSATRPHLARLSGRTGRVLWDLPLADRAIPVPSYQSDATRTATFEDLDGDGSLDALCFIRSPSADPNAEGVELKAVSLRDGRPLWSRFFDTWAPTFAIFDAGEPRRPVVAVSERVIGDKKGTLPIHAVDGRDGKLLWTWRGAVDDSRMWSMMTRREGDAGRRVCISFVDPGQTQRIVVLDADGHEGAARAIPEEKNDQLLAVDLDGDGRDELITYHGSPVRALGRGLEELWPRPEEAWWVRAIIPATADRPTATLLLGSGLAVDGRTGRPAWLSAAPPERGWLIWGETLDPGDSARPPRFLAHPPGLTICRSAVPATPAGAPAPPVGVPVPPGRADNDPRWTRPLPWTRPIRHGLGAKWLLAFVGLALVNVTIPLAILRLAARRRPWTIRLLMALPIAAAIPLTVFQTVEPLIPAEIGTRPVAPRLVFGLATLAGVPIVALAWVIALGLLRRRWRSLAVLIALTLAASTLLAAAWIEIDRGNMPAIEHYGWSGWYLIALPGASVVGVMIIVGWVLRGIYRGISSVGTRSAPRTMEAVPSGSATTPD